MHYGSTSDNLKVLIILEIGKSCRYRGNIVTLCWWKICIDIFWR